jgi:hypothetical protein
MSQKRSRNGPNKTQRDVLVIEARQHLREASNEANAPSTRHAAACDALLCCYRAGLVDRSDASTTFNWGRYRAAIRPQGNEPQLDVTLAWMGRLLK